MPWKCIFFLLVAVLKSTWEAQHHTLQHWGSLSLCNKQPPVAHFDPILFFHTTWLIKALNVDYSTAENSPLSQLQHNILLFLCCCGYRMLRLRKQLVRAGLNVLPTEVSGSANAYLTPQTSSCRSSSGWKSWMTALRLEPEAQKKRVDHTLPSAVVNRCLTS